MTIYRIVYGCDNGADGQGVMYARNSTEARHMLKEARRRHDHGYDHVIPQIQPIQFESLTKGTLLDLLRQETEPLRQ